MGLGFFKAHKNLAQLVLLVSKFVAPVPKLKCLKWYVFRTVRAV
jgi:hypothetical protein